MTTTTTTTTSSSSMASAGKVFGARAAKETAEKSVVEYSSGDEEPKPGEVLVRLGT